MSIRRTYVKPTVTEIDSRSGKRERFEHPAFGIVTLSTVSHGPSATLFGSETKHPQTVRVEVREAIVDRDLGKNWYHGNGGVLIEFEMSFSQFANFVMSSGKGDGTPCTLIYTRDGNLVGKPNIAPVESEVKTLKKEVRESVNESLEDLQKQIDQLAAMVEEGKFGKKAVAEIVKGMRNTMDNAGRNLEFSVTSAERAIEKIVESAKTDIEAFIDNHARQVGYENIKQMGLIEGSKGE